MPRQERSFTLLSFNVLLPNSVDGWWLYKYYRPEVPETATAWPARQAQLKALILRADADIVCVQEASPETFEQDFAFMLEAGYKAALYNKGRMRSATFWQPSVFEEVLTSHKDRVLVTQLRHSQGPDLYVLNCHLSAGNEAPRRLRQVHDALDAVRKEALKAKAHPCRVVVCGDFNSQGQSAVRELLLRGEVHPDFRESGDPTERGGANPVTSKVKKQTLGAFQDTYAAAFGEGSAPATLIVPLLTERMLTPGTSDMSAALRVAITDMFRVFSADGERLTREEVERWLLRINKVVGRGSEYRSAMKRLEGKDALALEDFLAVYQAEVEDGKFWGVEHDLLVCTGRGMAEPGTAPFAAVFDYIFSTGASLELLAVQELLTAKEAALVAQGDSLPNTWHPSDHLPVTATLRFR
eukprot:GGOE01040883.1.p1 GENE.GGOE01040883.1~~GGOE01040883.1.p1  ORF type:complete len:443 (+),score=135.76 GGOE01040883.1:99-1331(+)